MLTTNLYVIGLSFINISNNIVCTYYMATAKCEYITTALKNVTERNYLMLFLIIWNVDLIIKNITQLNEFLN